MTHEELADIKKMIGAYHADLLTTQPSTTDLAYKLGVLSGTLMRVIKDYEELKARMD